MIAYPLVLYTLLFHLNSALHKKGQHPHPTAKQVLVPLDPRTRRMSSVPDFGNGGATYKSFEEIIRGDFLISGDIPDSVFPHMEVLTNSVLSEIVQVDVAITSVDVRSRGPGQSVTLSFSYLFMPRVTVFQALVEAGDGDNKGHFHMLLEKAITRHGLQGFDTSAWHVVSMNTKQEWLWVRKPVPASTSSRSTSTVTTTLTTPIVEHTSLTSESSSTSATQGAMTTSTSTTARLALDVATLSTTTWSQVTNFATQVTTQPPPLSTTSAGKQGTQPVSRSTTPALPESSGVVAREFGISRMALILMLVGALAVITVIVALCIAGRSVAFRAAATGQTPILVKHIGRMFSRGDLDYAWNEGNLGFPHAHGRRCQVHPWPSATHGMDVGFANAPQPPREILESLPQPPAQRPKLLSESHCISHHAQPQRSSLQTFAWANSPGERTCAHAQPSQNDGPRSASRHSPRREGPRLAGTSSPNKSSMTAGACPNCVGA